MIEVVLVMKIISWNCNGGLINKRKHESLLNLSPDIAVIQECRHPDVDGFPNAFNYYDFIWKGGEGSKGLCVLSFSKDYKLSVLVSEIKYEWVVPIKVSGKADFVLLAVWTKRSPGYSSYGKLLYSALKEYEHFLSNNRVIIVGDFNVDKKLRSSYSGIKGYNQITDLFNSHGIKSCYHHFSNEEYGLESKATHYYHRKSDRPFHIDYCFVSEEILQSTKAFYIGESEEWVKLSDHFPLVLEATIIPTSVKTNTIIGVKES